GGFYENVPRMLPDGVTAKIRKDSYPMLPIFPLIQRTGEIAEQMMYNTFNMGIGMVLAVREADVKSVLAAAQEAGEQAYVIGEVTASANPEEKGVVLC
ncbi:MAG: phosphoribosylformylglycinamidine cyclo-ligase, partial [Lachnospiraceae bacterium]|nr:phosphoribosylformylglycinamidine cyclo-ligase [Lachnospiraceae bacterium]